MKNEIFRIGGMTCAHCQNTIERALRNTDGIAGADVDFNSGTASVTYNEAVITADGIAGIVKKLGYSMIDGRERAPALEAAGTLILILALFLLLRGLGMGSLAQVFPVAEEGMGYGMLFVIGLLTSLHCAAMCGGINISQCIPAVPGVADGAKAADGKKRRFNVPRSAVLYNAGRVASYTVIGGIAGAAGSVISAPAGFAGVVQLAAGAFMVIMGIGMLGLFPALRRFTPRLPKIFAQKIDGQRAGGRNPLVIGLLNGLMPCGPLQAMQLYALSTGSPAAGAFSMFLFSMGTVPLMFGVGALSAFLSNGARGQVFAKRVTRAGAVLVTVMGLMMAGYGINLSGINLDFAGDIFASERPPAMAAYRAGQAERTDGAALPEVEDGVQIVNSALRGGRYPAIVVRQGLPVRWTIDAPAGSINGCNNRMIIREYGIEYRFKTGGNVIEFMPEKAGRFTYSCWMGMIRSTITVVADGETPVAAETGSDTDPSPAGVVIQAENVLKAEMAGNGAYQTASVNLRDDGMDPAVIVFQRGVPAAWTINNDSLDPGNSRLIFPAYYTRLDMERGDNLIELLPTDDFDFSTADNVFYGFVKVVDDLDNVNIKAVRTEASEHETLIYPDAYFEAEAGGCCAR
ncbi:MAG: sulfite exporter TauE/SafE family protein [Spirochaetaceae bacterium]|jgi:sulfite exporter TauE/SafE/copper chaperone CopZ/plastocyanin domain-containing protein|nr:sulfite exporter TauE/SafE family protein [Spirochaetaceae bacterium]